MEVKQQSPRPFFRPSSGGGAFRTSGGVGGAALLTPKVEADAASSAAAAAASVLVSTVIKTEPRSDSPCASISMGRFRPPTDSGSGASVGNSYLQLPATSAAMHPISISLLHSASPASSQQQQPPQYPNHNNSNNIGQQQQQQQQQQQHMQQQQQQLMQQQQQHMQQQQHLHHLQQQQQQQQHPSFYGSGSSPSPSPVKRSRSGGMGVGVGGGGGGGGAAATEEWLPSPSQMSVDSMSPPPPTAASSSSAGVNGHSTLPPSVSSNGYSPSPMSTGSYEPPYSPGGKMGREDLSPPGSVNGYSVDSFGDAKKKKGPVPRQQEELCLVCGDRASGYHYNALTCEGCKGFFRRSITKNAVYQCKYGNGCEIDMYMRRKCQECRLKKCLTVGMRPECVVPEYQCAVKREAKKAQKEKDRPNPTSIGSPEMKEAEVKVIHQLNLIEEKPTAILSSNGVKPLSPEQNELINRLVHFQEEFDQPSEEDLRNISTSGIHESDSEAKFKHITEMTILTVQLTVEFSKRLPGFDTLLREDQITLLKACSSEVMMLRCARRYDANTDSIVFANNLPYTRDSYNMAGVGDTAEPLFRFGKQMSNMKVDNAEYALLTAVVIFSERPGLVEARKVEKIQEIYLEALQAYVMNHRVRPMTEFAKLLSVLTELRTLGNLNSEMCFSLKLKNKKLPPFLAEIWDVHS